MKFKKSLYLLKAGKKVIPGGTNTFSKSILIYPPGVSPQYAKSANGCYLIDQDQNKFLDFNSALAAVNIGYNNRDINDAAIKQIKVGTNFSLPYPTEIELSKNIIKCVPSAEMVRFGKNGADATSAAIRLSRFITQKNHVLICGYHGWHDWYVSSTDRSLGIPNEIRKLSHSFEYNNFETVYSLFKKFKDNVACVIMEPMNLEYPKDNFLEKIKEICRKNKSLLIFDEVITGFRFAKGGAQQELGVVPDLTALGKGMANGFPISALVGKRKYMKNFDKVFFSGTHGSESVSIAASLKTLEKVTKHNVPSFLKKTGKILMEETNRILNYYNLSSYIKCSGHPSWSFISFKTKYGYSVNQIKSFWLQEMFENNIINLGAHNMSYSHKIKEISKLLKVYKMVFPKMDEILRKKKLSSNLKFKTLKPIIKIRNN